MNLDKIFKNRGEILFLSASLFAAALNYFSYPIIGRVLKGDVLASSINILNIVTVLGGMFASSTLVGLYIQKNYKTDSIGRKLLSHAQAIMFVQILLCLLIVAAASPFIASFLRISSSSYVVIALLLIYFGAILSTWVGYFNGAKFFRYSSILLVANSLFQLLAMIIYTSFSRNEYSPAVGFLVGTIASLVLAYKISSKRLPVSIPRFHKGNEFKHIGRYSTFSFLAFVLLWIGQSFDVIIARLSLNKDAWVNFSLVSLYPKVMYFLGFTAIWIVLSKLSDQKYKAHFAYLLRVSLLLVFFLSIFSTVMLYIRPALDTIFVGNRIDFPILTISLVFAFKVIYVLFSLLCCVSLLYRKPFASLVLNMLIICALLLSLILVKDLSARLITANAIVVVGIVIYFLQFRSVGNETDD